MADGEEVDNLLAISVLANAVLNESFRLLSRSEALLEAIKEATGGADTES